MKPWYIIKYKHEKFQIKFWKSNILKGNVWFFIFISQMIIPILVISQRD